MLAKTLKRAGRVAHRYWITGRFGAAPGPIIERFFGGKDCFFVQVGSNDGVTGDPLHALIKKNPQWRGIFVEALDEAFARLVQNYPPDERFVFENVAISDTLGEQWFYYVSLDTIRDNDFDDLQVISTLNRDYILSTLQARAVCWRMTKAPETYISQKLVRCETISSILDRHNVARVDLLHIDAESHDYRIMKQFDFQRFSPKLIVYEHRALSVADLRSAEALLTGHGYRLTRGGLDTVAVRRDR